MRITETAAIQGGSGWRSARILDIITETPRAKRVIIEVPSWEGHYPGQYVDVLLSVEDSSQAQRSYSIASAPEDKQLTLVVGRSDNGEISLNLLDELRVGDRLHLRGPIGDYFYWEADAGSPLLLVAGGSGVAPLMAIIRHRAAVGSDVPTRLLYSSRSPEDIIYRDELDRLARSDESFEVVYTFTRTQSSDWTGYRRRIDKKMLGEVAWHAQDKPLAFVCGPAPLVETVKSGLISLGYDRMRIKS